MYDSWTCSRWETPVSDADVLMMELHHKNGVLTMVLDSSDERGAAPIVYIEFDRVPCFRNIIERYRGGLWRRLDEMGRPGRTFIVEESPWVLEISSQDPSFMAFNKNIKHYIIATDWDVVEVLSNSEPRVRVHRS